MEFVTPFVYAVEFNCEQQQSHDVDGLVVYFGLDVELLSILFLF